MIRRAYVALVCVGALSGCPRTGAEKIEECAIQPRWSVQTAQPSGLYPLATTLTGDVLAAFVSPIEIEGMMLPESTLVFLHDGSLAGSRQLPGRPAVGPIAISETGFGLVTLFDPDALLVFDPQLQTRWMGARGADADVAPTGEVVTSESNGGLKYFDATGAQRWSAAYAYAVRMTTAAEVFAWTLTQRTHYSSTGQVLDQIAVPQATIGGFFDRAGSRIHVSGTMVHHLDPAGATRSIDLMRPAASPVISATGELVVLLRDPPELARIDQAGNVRFVDTCEGGLKVVWADDTGYVMIDPERIARFDWP
jgi:hypothetical protein